MALTDTAIRNAKPQSKLFKMGDTLGLFLLVQPSGGKLWRFKYRVDGREKKLALGTYPDVSLSEARGRRDEARRTRAVGNDPAVEKRRENERKRASALDTFKAIADEYCQKRRRDGEGGWASATATRSEYLLAQLRGSIGAMPISAIKPRDVLEAVRRIERKGNLESARRTLQLSRLQTQS